MKQTPGYWLVVVVLIGILYLVSPTLFKAGLAAVFLFPVAGLFIVFPVLAVIGVLAAIISELIGINVRSRRK
jgi:hypothetical protein